MGLKLLDYLLLFPIEAHKLGFEEQGSYVAQTYVPFSIKHK